MTRPRLSKILDKARAAHTLPERIDWLCMLMRWMRRGEIPREFGTNSPENKLRYLGEALRAQEDLHQAVRSICRGLFTDTRGLELFRQTGIYEEAGFFSELLSRTLKYYLPAPPQHDNIAFFFSKAFSRRSDAAWIAAIPSDSIAELISVVMPEEAATLRLRQEMTDALIILSARLLALSLSPELDRFSAGQRVTDSVFFKLNDHIRNRIPSAQKGTTTDEVTDIGLLLEQCRVEISRVFQNLEEVGVSVSLVYCLEHQQHLLRRIEHLYVLSFSQRNEAFYRSLLSFVANLVEENHKRDSVRALLSENFHLLSRKIVERTGDTGEHYITRNRKEYFGMLNSASGGGFLTAGTAYLKVVITYLHAAPFFEGLLYSLNYTGSFILLQLMNFTLATKQPSMTASTLAGKLRITSNEERSEFVEEVASITRSQFAAVIGNLGIVIPISICVDLMSQMLVKSHALTTEKALKTLESLHPFQSWTIAGAVVTGVTLWFSSICAGWFENWWVYRQISAGIAHHRMLNLFFGRKFSEKLAAWVSRGAGGLAGNIALGFLLGFTPVFWTFFGIPLDVRHVTLATSTLTLALCALWSSLDGLPVWPVLGIFVTLCLNFGVSFLLSLFVATKARRIPGISSWPVLKPILLAFTKSPARFLFPIRP